MKDTIYRLIEAMTFHRSHAESKITELGMPMLEHILKIYLFPDASYVKGWTKEIRGWYRHILNYATSLKKGKKFSASDVKDLLYDDMYEFNISKLQDLVTDMVEINDELVPRKYDIHKLAAILQIVYLEISECAVLSKPWASVVINLMVALK